MKRRAFIAALGGAAAWPLVARGAAARADAAHRRADADVRDDPEVQARVAAFLQGLQQLGWTDGRNVRIDIRWSRGGCRHSQTRGGIGRARAGRHPGLWQLRRWAPLLQATRTVPIVFVHGPDPVGAGFVDSWRGRAATPPVLSCSNTP